MFQFFGIFVLFLSVVRCEEDLINFVGSRLHVGTCRAACIEKFLPQNEFQNGSDLGCRTTNNWKCFMCWDYCDMLLEDEEKLDQMCADDICMEGCQYSCQFYKDEKVEQWNRGSSQIKDVKFVNSSTLTWNYETLGEVFVIFGSDEDGEKWSELRQSAENQIPIYEESIRNVTIFSLSARGLVSQVGYNLLKEQNHWDDYVIFDRIINKSKKLVHYVEENWTYLAFALSFVCSFVLSVFVLLFLLKITRSKRLVKRTIHSSIFYIEVDMNRPNAFLSEV